MKMNCKDFSITWLIIVNFLQEFILIQSRKSDDGLKPYEIDENLLRKRCELICYRENGQHFNKCSIPACIRDITKLSKPGGCSYEFQSSLEDTCYEDCRTLDYECPGVKKCCRRKCGWSCQDPIGLQYDSRLPPIPTNITITEGRRKTKIIDLSWHMPLNRTQRPHTYFVVEIRSHIGNVFNERKLGYWQWITFDKRSEEKSHIFYTKIIHANVKLKSGRWYQFRIAAINEYGFQGYSNISKPFKLSIKNQIAVPKPPKPVKNLSITSPRLLTNGSIHVRVTWNAPKSDLPIEKYRISWALYLKAENDSLLLNEAYVREPTKYYDFWNLAINSIYYIQVQAISVNGKKRLKSSKESKLLNTTVPAWSSSNSLTNSNNNNNNNSSNSNTNNNDYDITTKLTLQSSSNARLPEIIIKFIPNRKLGMVVRIIWDEFYKGSILELCTSSNEQNCKSTEYATVKSKRADHVDFRKLNYNTQYTVRLLNPNIRPQDEVILKAKTFITPTCENWKRRFSNLSINC